MSFWAAWVLWGVVHIVGGRFYDDPQAWRLGWLAFIVAQIPLGLEEALKWVGKSCV